MKDSKYFYNGIPLSQYCDNNNINKNTIISRIWKLKKNKKYENCTEQEIVNMVIEKYGSSIKYMYKGISLGKYCKENDINYKTIYKRIENIKKEKPNLTNDEIVILAIKEFENKNYRFFYKGEPLIEYCMKHPEIKYNTIRSYINRKKEQNPELEDEKLIEQYIKKNHKGIYKYYYLGIPLKQYCEENNLIYKNIISYINRNKNNDKFKCLSDDELVEVIMDQYQPFKPKYLYKGVTLRLYCEKNNISYYSIVSYVKRGLKKDYNKNIDDLIDEGINTINRYGIIYYYNGIPLKDYARNNNLNISSIRCAILRKQLKSDKPLQEIINECVQSYQKFSIKYYYNDIPLITYCDKVGLNYNTVIHRYLDEYAENDKISIDEAIKQIIEYYLKNPPNKTKYYFNGQSLAKFCDINGYSYFAIWRKIKNIDLKDELLNKEKIVEEAIIKYENRLQIKKINDIFNKLKNKNINDINELKNICEFLKIDYENVLDLIKMDFSYNQAINMIWYFFDKKINGDLKIITDKKIKDIFILIDKLRKSDTNIEEFELYDLIGIYKSELYDSRNDILIKQKKYMNKIIFSICRSYEIKVNNSNYCDFESEIKLYFITLLNRTNLNIYGQIIKYMDLTIKGYFKSYLNEYKKQNNILLLDDIKYSSDRGARNEKSRIDYIADLSNDYQNKDISFSSNMMEVLVTLSSEDLNFIMLKYQENYSDNELTNLYKISIDDVKEKEKYILNLIKQNQNIKYLIKK